MVGDPSIRLQRVPILGKHGSPQQHSAGEDHCAGQAAESWLRLRGKRLIQRGEGDAAVFYLIPSSRVMGVTTSI